ncbi:MAG: hypothetical protein ACI8VT_000033 [Saprospiraceae bacterium]|jgi:hypothetical protein
MLRETKWQSASQPKLSKLFRLLLQYYSYPFFFACLLSGTQSLSAQSLFINEFVASNSSGLSDEAGEFEDWVEIYNDDNIAIDVGGMYMTDDLTIPTLWQIPSNDPNITTISPGGFLVVFFDKDINQGILHIDAKLSDGGEAIGLFAADGTTLIDSYIFGPQLPDRSEGRNPDGGAEWSFYSSPTPGETNNSPLPGQTAIPVASIGGGIYPSGSFTVSLTSATPGATIYYTLDASDPDDDATAYSGSLTIDDVSTIRAIAYKSSLGPSKIMTHTYLIGVAHNFAIIALNTDPDHLYDEEEGIFENRDLEIEQPAHVAFYEPDGTLAFAQDIEIELHGNAASGLPQKSLKLKAKSNLGNEFFNYPIFPDLPYDTYRSILIRNSGQDWNKSWFRDAMAQNLFSDVTDLNGIIKDPNLDSQGYRPGVVYLNGEYFGIYNIREQMNWKYINTHYGLDKDEVDIVENADNEVSEGDDVEWNAFQDFLEDNNMSSDENYNILKTKVEVEHYIDYQLQGILIDNNDWPGNNNKHWRERTPSGKWRWLTRDLDFGFGLHPLDGSWNSGDFTGDMLEACLDDNSSSSFNAPEVTLFLRRLMENDQSKNYFINRAADFLNTVFNADRVVDRIDFFENMYIPEMDQHMDVWQSGYNNNAGNVEKVRIFGTGREDEVRDHFVDYFSEINGTTNVTIDANPSIGGSVSFSTLTLGEAVFPWEGIYFRGIDIPIIAIPNRGYFFDDWSSGLGDEAATTLNISSGNYALTANFIIGSTATNPIVINEINYSSPDNVDPGDWVELYNPNSFSVNLSGWYFEDESGNFFGLPANTTIPAGAYFILAEDKNIFLSIYPGTANVFGDFAKDPGGFNLSSKGERITLTNASGILIDEVAYDDKTPWPVEADGNGPTLQLIDPSFDNALAQSWIAFDATPGMINGAALIATCPANIEIILSPGTLSTIVNWDAPMLNDICAFGGAIITQVDGSSSGSTFGVGTTSISYEATDNCGNEQICSFEVTVSTTSSTIEISCSEDFPITVDEGVPGQIVSWSVPQATSDCTTGNISINQTNGLTSGSFFSLGTHTITYEAVDDCGSSATCSFIIVITEQGNSNLSLECPLDINIEIPAGETSVMVNWALPTASTDCDGGGGQNANCDNDNLPGFNFLGELNNQKYFLSTEKDLWPNAEAICEGFDAHLVVINDASENQFLQDNTAVSLHIGIHDSNSEGTLEWVNGETVAYTNFGSDNNSATNDYGYFRSWNAAWTMKASDQNKKYVMELDCGGGSPVNVSQTSGPDNGSNLSAGTYTISYTATDDCGSVQNCSFNIVITTTTSTSIDLDCQDNIFITVPEGSTGQVINWSAPQATTDCTVGNLSINQTGGLPNGSFFSTGTQTITYEAENGCGDSEACSFTISVEEEQEEEPPTGYCISGGTAPWQEHITNVTFGSINNDSGKDGYGDFTDQSTTVVAGESYLISILPKFSYTQYDEYIQVWIDFEKDIDFNDQGELVFSTIRNAGPANSTVDPITAIIDIPNVLLENGSTRMRISMARDAYANPCDIFERGEVEDYTIELTGSSFSGMQGDSQNPQIRADRNNNLATAFITAYSDELFVYPNPAKNLITLRSGLFDESPVNIKLVNLLGQTINSWTKIPVDGNTCQLKIKEQAEGTYFMMVTQGNKTFTKLLVIRR